MIIKCSIKKLTGSVDMLNPGKLHLRRATQLIATSDDQNRPPLGIKKKKKKSDCFLPWLLSFSSATGNSSLNASLNKLRQQCHMKYFYTM